MLFFVCTLTYLQRFPQIYHILEGDTFFYDWMIIVVNKKVFHYSKSFKATFFIERNSQRTISGKFTDIHFASYTLNIFHPLYIGYLFRSSSVTSLITLHGLPAAITPLGISLFTVLPAPITVPLPIVTPGTTVTLAPIHTSSPIVIGSAISRPSPRCFASIA